MNRQGKAERIAFLDGPCTGFRIGGDTFHFGEGNGIVSRGRRNIRTFKGSLEGHFIFRHHIGSVVCQYHSQSIFGNGSDCFQPIAICRDCLDCQYRLIGYFVVRLDFDISGFYRKGMAVARIDDRNQVGLL